MKVNIYKECKEKIKTKDKISVIVPNYNYERFLKERIDSILLQTVPIYELILLDDASSDESVSYLNKKIEEIKKNYPHIKIKTAFNKDYE